MKFEWEEIFSQNGYRQMHVGTWRAKVIGGWLICNTLGIDNVPATGLCFVPDPGHLWEIKKD